ncbi:MAG: hypothetical protein ABSD38_27265 [Syntrophorhabdales bacterium]|jgi:hypothetical protein
MKLAKKRSKRIKNAVRQESICRERRCDMASKECNHRQSDGSATQEDLDKFHAGDECPICGCTLGADGWWYLDAEQAPTEEE